MARASAQAAAEEAAGLTTQAEIKSLSSPPRMAGIAQCLSLEHEIHHTASKLCILGFKPLE
jgi:hypothetical protein